MRLSILRGLSLTANRCYVNDCSQGFGHNVRGINQKASWNFVKANRFRGFNPRG